MVEYVDSTIFVDLSSPQNISVRHVFLCACLILRMRCYQEITAFGFAQKSAEHRWGGQYWPAHKANTARTADKSACGYISNETVVLWDSIQLALLFLIRP